jgi:hypothetical protein
MIASVEPVVVHLAPDVRIGRCSPAQTSAGTRRRCRCQILEPYRNGPTADRYAYKFALPRRSPPWWSRSRAARDQVRADDVDDERRWRFASSLRAVVDPGEVIYLSPPWFFYADDHLSRQARCVNPLRRRFSAGRRSQAVSARTARSSSTRRTPQRHRQPELKRLAAVLEALRTATAVLSTSVR